MVTLSSPIRRDSQVAGPRGEAIAAAIVAMAEYSKRSTVRTAKFNPLALLCPHSGVGGES